MHSIYLTISVIIGIIPQVMVIYGIYKGAMKLSFSTYTVWFILNLIICTASIIEHGNYALSLTYTLFNLIIALMVLRSERKIIFPNWERFVIFLSIVCIIIWYFTNGAYAVIAGATASFIAGIPQLVVVYRYPQLTSTNVWILGTLAPFFSILGGLNWSIVERFYPIVFFLYGVSGLIFLYIGNKKSHLLKEVGMI